MSTTTLHQPRPTPASPSRPVRCLHEVAAWLHEVGPVVAALPVGAAPSPGQRRWLAEQNHLAAEALAFLECSCFEAEGAGEPCDDLQWLHTRAAALLHATAARSALASAA
jgi:hypothetical protein